MSEEPAESGAAREGTKPVPGKRAKHPPVPIALEDGRCGHVIAGLGDRTKRTKYDVRLETGERVQVPKKLYGTPSNVDRLSLVPKAWLAGDELPFDKLPELLKALFPAKEAEGGSGSARKPAPPLRTSISFQ